MKRIVILSAISVFVISIFIAVIYLRFQSGNNNKVISYGILKNGDLVLRRGKSIESFAVYVFDKNRDYSHIGIVAVENNQPYIIHIVPDKPNTVRKDLPQEFLSNENASHYLVLRSNFSQSVLNNVSSTALQFYTDKLVFDNNYNIQNDSALYCTELVLKAFKKNNITFPDMLPQSLKLIIGTYSIYMPGAFLTNSHFTGIIAG